RGSAPDHVTGYCHAGEQRSGCASTGSRWGSAPALLMVGGRLKGDTSPPVWTLAPLRSASQWWTGP
ncbi:MAG: hypothetical protein ACK5Q6_17490, partial [Cyanobacteriota bacterium]